MEMVSFTEFRPAPLTIDVDSPDWLPLEVPPPDAPPIPLTAQTIARMLKQGQLLPERVLMVFHADLEQL